MKSGFKSEEIRMEEKRAQKASTGRIAGMVFSGACPLVCPEVREMEPLSVMLCSLLLASSQFCFQGGFRCFPIDEKILGFGSNCQVSGI